MDRKIIITTDRATGLKFKVSEEKGVFTSYRIEEGHFFSNNRRIGETRSLEDAIKLIKTSVPGNVRNVKIEDF